MTISKKTTFILLLSLFLTGFFVVLNTNSASAEQFEVPEPRPGADGIDKTERAALNSDCVASHGVEGTSKDADKNEFVTCNWSAGLTQEIEQAWCNKCLNDFLGHECGVLDTGPTSSTTVHCGYLIAQTSSTPTTTPTSTPSSTPTTPPSTPSYALPCAFDDCSSIGAIWNNFCRRILLFATPIFVIMILVAAYDFMIGGAQAHRISRAKKTLQYGGIGYLVLLLSCFLPAIIAGLL
ncbi:MAG: hypothetical protein WDZ40_03440 [Candidatus Spechtbacterales bacterium]